MQLLAERYKFALFMNFWVVSWVFEYHWTGKGIFHLRVSRQQHFIFPISSVFRTNTRYVNLWTEIVVLVILKCSLSKSANNWRLNISFKNCTLNLIWKEKLHYDSFRKDISQYSLKKLYLTFSIIVVDEVGNILL